MASLPTCSRMFLVLFAAAACGDDADDGGNTMGDGSTTGTATTSSTEGTSSTATTASTTTLDPSSSETSTSSDATSTTTADTSAGEASETSGAVCGDVECALDEVCVLPCCGGPAPPCVDSAKDGSCDPEDEPVPADQCNSPCATPTCCIDNCTADPPYCAPTADLMCSGGGSCNIDGCFGTVQDGQLYCECA